MIAFKSPHPPSDRGTTESTLPHQQVKGTSSCPSWTHHCPKPWIPSPCNCPSLPRPQILFSGAGLTAIHSSSWYHEDSSHNMLCHSAHSSWQAVSEKYKSLRFNLTGEGWGVVFQVIGTSLQATQWGHVGDRPRPPKPQPWNLETPEQTSPCLPLYRAGLPGHAKQMKSKASGLRWVEVCGALTL